MGVVKYPVLLVRRSSVLVQITRHLIRAFAVTDTVSLAGFTVQSQALGEWQIAAEYTFYYS